MMVLSRRHCTLYAVVSGLQQPISNHTTDVTESSATAEGPRDALC